MCSAFGAARDDALRDRACFSSSPRAAAAGVLEEEPKMEMAAALSNCDRSTPVKVQSHLSVCAYKGLTFKPEKFKFYKKEVEFVGFDACWDSFKLSEDCLSAIKSFSMPQKPTISDIRSCYGFVNQLVPFLTTVQIMTHFIYLLKKLSGKQVYWNEHLQEKFRQVHDIVCKLAKDSLTYYNKLRPTVAVTDWSKEGEGFVILEQYCSCTSVETPSVVEMEQCTIDEKTVEEAAIDEPAYQLLLARVTEGDWNPKKSQKVACLRTFYGIRESLSISGNLVTYCFNDNCICLVIPEGLRHQITANLHAGHQGLNIMVRRARHSVYWPGIEGDLQHHRSGCTLCEAHTPSLPTEVMKMTPAPEYPFQQTVMDLFQLEGHMYMAYCDRLTGWLEKAHFPNGTSSAKVMT
ncbi:uncharacterized protein [Palaemon carinicauda]|uniref:uncharacterized protein n=1 Tax=Palaemon carinicauda TaxID=392227 RepID=UPI0035B5C73F